MESSRIYRVLSSLTAPQLNRFIKFIQSPYFNKNATIEALAVYLVKKIKTKASLDEKPRIWTLVGHEIPFNDLKFRKLCNDTLERFEEFLIEESLSEQKLLRTNMLLQSLKKNNYEVLIEKHISKSNRTVKRELDQSSDYLLQKYIRVKTLHHLKTNDEKRENVKTLQGKSYQDLESTLDAFYVIEKLRLAIDVLTWQKMYKSIEEVNIESSLQLIKTKGFQDIPAVRIYHLMYLLHTEEDDRQHYFELLNSVTENLHLFPKIEQREIFDVMISYCVKWINKGHSDFYVETLRLYDWGIEEDIILFNGKLSPVTFSNYVVSGLRIKEFNRVEKFIKENARILDDERRDNALNFNLGRVAFYRKDFNKVLEHLNLVNYDDIWYNINSKVLLFASYYELDQEDVLLSSIDTFNTFLRREKDVQNIRTQRYLNFSKYLKRIVTHRYSKEKVLKIKEKLSSDKGVVNKPWLLEKIEEELN